jgi:cytochrome c-type biogenesis protein CcmF
MAGRIPSELRDLGIQFTLANIHPETGEFSINIATRQKDWIVIRALEKPFINILWLGTFVVMIGFTVAMTRRFGEFKKMKEKGLE